MRQLQKGRKRTFSNESPGVQNLTPYKADLTIAEFSDP
jgi:hypothetical protein